MTSLYDRFLELASAPNADPNKALRDAVSEFLGLPVRPEREPEPEAAE